MIDPFIGGAGINAAGGLLGGLVGMFQPNPYSAGGALRPEFASLKAALPDTMKGPWTDQQRQGYAQMMAQLFAPQAQAPQQAYNPMGQMMAQRSTNVGSVQSFLDAANRWKAMR
jgi:hypothetical protein